ALWLVDQDIVNVQAAVRRRDFFFEPCAAIFEYEDPGLLGMMDVSYAPKMWMRSSYYGADEFFEVQGDEGFLWVTRCTGEMLDLAPLMVYRGPEAGPSMTEVSDIDTDWATGFARSSAHFIDALRHGTPPDMSPADAIKVGDLDAAIRFYQGMGAKVRDRMEWSGGERVDVTVGALEITLFTRAIYEDAVTLDADCFLHPALFTDDLDRQLEGHPVIWGPAEVSGPFGRRRIAFVEAPGNIRLEFMEQLDDPLDDRKAHNP
ncbi:MAG TPA: hypothetical protein VHW93_11235, partial [Acidimicrobiales bacterium]|nr:hypothetical protein [Acidimicrobiales bacterium]